MIRLATVTDIPALMALLEQVRQVHYEVRPDLFQAQGTKFSPDQLEKLLADTQKPVFVYEVEGQILGHLFCIIEDKAGSDVLTPIKTLFIDDLCVDEKGRGQGIGQAFYAFARDYAKQQGCHNVTLHAFNDNVQALKFYEKLGMKPMYTQMEEIL